MEELYYKIDPVDAKIKNDLVINNEHIFCKHYHDCWKFARLSNIRIEVEEALNSEVPEFILNN